MQIFLTITVIVLAVLNIILFFFLTAKFRIVFANQQMIYDNTITLINLLDTVHHDAEFALQLKRQIEINSVEEPDPDEEYLTQQFLQRTGGDVYDA